MYVKMVTRPVYKKLKEPSITTKEVNTPPNKMKHNSPLQRHAFLPLTCIILKRIHIFSPFLSWLTKGIRSYKASPEKHKDDLIWSRDTRNPYKCMNVTKQDAMDNKIKKKKKCKTKKSKEHARVSRLIEEVLKIYWEEANLDGSRICRACVEQTKSTIIWLDGLAFLLRSCRGQT